MFMNEPCACEVDDDLKLSTRAAWSSYLALAGIWFVLGVLYLFAGVSNDGMGLSGAFLAIAVGVLWVVWLHGFRLVIDGRFVTYRDGMYRSFRAPASEVSAVRSTWVKRAVLGREIRIPRLVIDYGDGRHLEVNTKPFSRQDIRSAVDLIRRTEAHPF